MFLLCRRVLALNSVVRYLVFICKIVDISPVSSFANLVAKRAIFILTIEGVLSVSALNCIVVVGVKGVVAVLCPAGRSVKTRGNKFIS